MPIQNVYMLSTVSHNDTSGCQDFVDKKNESTKVLWQKESTIWHMKMS